MPRPTIAAAPQRGCRGIRRLAEQDLEVLADEVGSVLDRRRPARGHEHLEQLPVAGLLVRLALLVHGVHDLVDQARDLALRDDEVTTPSVPLQFEP
jgi:hypothetical protein